MKVDDQNSSTVIDERLDPLMAHTHWPKPRPRQGRETNGLYETAEAFTLHLNQDMGRDLLSSIVVALVPVSVSVPVTPSVNAP